MPRAPHPMLFVTLVLFCALAALIPSHSSAQPASRLFPQTGYSVREPFLSAWEQGGIALFGLPISGELTERSRDDGRHYTVQYFERARLEFHSDPDQPIKIGRLGAELAPPATTVSPCAPFPETGYGLCGQLGAFWAANGGVAAFGYPVGPPQLAIGPDGVVREVQYTERARIERDFVTGQITLGLLGRERLAAAQLVPPPPPPPAVAPEVQRIVDLVNGERAAAGLGPLQLAQELTAAAQVQSEGMASTGFISHTGADGRGPAERIADAGYRWLRCGENIAVGQATPEEAMAFWMGSPPHRANILDPGMREIGVGYLWIPAGYGHYWTITLGER